MARGLQCHPLGGKRGQCDKNGETKRVPVILGTIAVLNQKPTRISLPCKPCGFALCPIGLWWNLAKSSTRLEPGPRKPSRTFFGPRISSRWLLAWYPPGDILEEAIPKINGSQTAEDVISHQNLEPDCFISACLLPALLYEHIMGILQSAHFWNSTSICSFSLHVKSVFLLPLPKSTYKK